MRRIVRCILSGVAALIVFAVLALLTGAVGVWMLIDWAFQGEAHGAKDDSRDREAAAKAVRKS